MIAPPEPDQILLDRLRAVFLRVFPRRVDWVRLLHPLEQSLAGLQPGPEPDDWARAVFAFVGKRHAWETLLQRACELRPEDLELRRLAEGWTGPPSAQTGEQPAGFPGPNPDDADHGERLPAHSRDARDADRPGRGASFLGRVREVCALRERASRIEVVSDPRSGQRHLLVHGEREGYPTRYAVGALEGSPDTECLDGFRKAHEGCLEADPGAVSLVVCAQDPPPAGSASWFPEARIRVRSFREYQQLVDFGAYLAKLESWLDQSPLYPHDLYVTQTMQIRRGVRDETKDDALAEAEGWLLEGGPCLAVVLASFGHGKTFLLRELTRRLLSRHTEGAPVPLFVSLREQEKLHTLDHRLAQAFLDFGLPAPDPACLRYLVREGRVALLFDGYDELALQVTYASATDQFGSILEAADGNARVVVTSRRQHFENEQQVRTALAGHVARLPGHRFAYLKGFRRDQIRQFLGRVLGNETEADARMVLLDRIGDLMGLAENPRLLSFIARIDAARLEQTREQRGSLHSSDLYELLLREWLEFEGERVERPPHLTDEQRWEAVTELALRAWERGGGPISVRSLGLLIGERLESLEALRIGADEGGTRPAASPAERDRRPQLFGSRTLLQADPQGRLEFLHRSVWEYLAARRIAQELRGTGKSPLLEQQPISLQIAEFLKGCLGLKEARQWAQRVEGSETASERLKAAAGAVLRRLGVPSRTRVVLAGQNHAGADFTGRDLTGADLRGANLTDALLERCRLDGADLTGSQLGGANLRFASLRSAHLDRADLTRTDLMGADLTGAGLHGAILSRTVLVGARGAALEGAAPRGSAPPDPDVRDVRATLLRPMRAAHSVAVTADGALIASGGEDGTVRVWDGDTGLCLTTMLGHRGLVYGVAWNGDGIRLASGGEDGTVRVWDTAAGRELHRLLGHGGWVRSVAWGCRPPGLRPAGP